MVDSTDEIGSEKAHCFDVSHAACRRNIRYTSYVSRGSNLLSAVAFEPSDVYPVPVGYKQTGEDRWEKRCGVFEFMELKEENFVPWPTLMAQLMMFVPVPWRS